MELLVAVLLDVEEHNGLAAMCFTTNIGERVVANAQNLIDVKYTSDNSEPSPYVHVRGGLSARLSRAVFLQLCEFAEVRGAIAGVSSCGVFMPLGPAE